LNEESLDNADIAYKLITKSGRVYELATEKERVYEFLRLIAYCHEVTGSKTSNDFLTYSG
jgi:hypothetical protein